MATLYDFFFKQIVAQDELDSAFAAIELADLNLALDTNQGLVQPAVLIAPDIDGGIRAGWTITNPSAFNITAAAGTGYDNSGRRIRTGSAFTVDCSVTGETAIGAGGTPAGGSSTDPGGVNERWISLFIRFDRLLSVPRIDGNSITVYYLRAESFVFKVTMGAPDPSPTRPPLETGSILLADIRRNTAGVLEIEDGTTATDRRQDWLVRESSTYPTRTLRTGDARAAIAKILEFYNRHVSNTSPQDKHAATAIDYAGGAAWADATTNPAATLEVQLDKILTDLGSTAGGTVPGGSAKIGSSATTGSLNTTGGAVSTTATHVKAQLDQLLVGINGRFQRGGDTVSGHILASSASNNLGDGTTRFGTAFLTALNVTGMASNLLTGGSTRDLGATGAGTNRWNVFAASVDVAGNIMPEADGTRDIGSAGLTWNAVFSEAYILDPALTMVHTIGAPAANLERTAAGASDWSVVNTLTTDGATRHNIRTISALGAGVKGGTASFPIDRVPDGATITGISIVWSGDTDDTLFYGAWLEANGTSNTRTAVGTASSTVGTAAIVSTSIFSGSIGLDRDARSFVVDLQASNSGAGALDVRVYCVNVTYTITTPVP
jgi:hypothetical protein